MVGIKCFQLWKFADDDFEIFNGEFKSDDQIICISQCPGSQLVCGSAEGELSWWKDGSNVQATKIHLGPLEAITVVWIKEDENASVVLTSGKDGRICITDMNRKLINSLEIGQLLLNCMDLCIKSIAVDTANNKLAIGF